MVLSVFCSPSRYTQGKNATDALGAEMIGLGLTGPALVVASRSPIRLLTDAWERTFGDAGITYVVDEFGGECSQLEVDRITGVAELHKSGVIVGVGGGKVLDAARAVAADLNLPIVNCLTVASSDSPCSATHRFTYGTPQELNLKTEEPQQFPTVRLLPRPLGYSE